MGRVTCVGDARRLRAGAAGALLALMLAWARAASADALADSIRYGVAITDVNRVGLTISNYGFLGNGFISRSPSFEFPLGTGYEHMSRAGLWIGGLARTDTGSFIGVSTGILDEAQGASGQGATEFTPASNSIIHRSRIQNNRFYSPLARSDQDLECSYSDRPGRAANTIQRERHTPLNVLVLQRTLGFSLDAADAFVVLQLSFVNLGQPLRDFYVGLYAQMVSGDRNAYSTWPPSSSSGPGSWYYKTHIDYDAPRRMAKEHYCLMGPYPTACQFGYCPPWAAMKVLRVHPGGLSDYRVGYHWWAWSPGDTLRDTDVERYAILSDSTIADGSGCPPGAGCSPIQLLGVGPFSEIDPGDTVSVDFAFIGGEDESALGEHADYAQFAASIDYHLPAAPPSPRLLIETGERRVDFYWDDSPESVEDETSLVPGHRDFEGYRVYLGLDRQHPARIAQFDLPDTTGYNTGLEAIRLAAPRVVDGVVYRYHYAATQLRDGISYYGGVTSYDRGDIQVPSLESGLGQNKFQAVPLVAPGESQAKVTVFPNPYRVEAVWDHGTLVRDHYLWFANLPRRAQLKIFTLSGDLVFDTRFDGATYHGEGTRGLYDPRQDIDTPPPSLSQASYAWDLITRQGQALATGLYLFTVENLATGSVQRGKFLVVKSDREER